MAKKEIASGVVIDPVLPATGKKLAVEYSGKLASSSDITLCVAYGDPPHDLRSQQEYHMHKQNQQWSTAITIPVPADMINLSFKDNQGSVDDNQGKYYSTPVNSDSISYA